MSRDACLHGPRSSAGKNLNLTSYWGFGHVPLCGMRNPLKKPDQEEKVEHWKKEKKKKTAPVEIRAWPSGQSELQRSWVPRTVFDLHPCLCLSLAGGEQHAWGLKASGQWGWEQISDLLKERFMDSSAKAESSNQTERLQQWLWGAPSLTSRGKLNEVRKIEFPTKQSSDHCSHLRTPARGKRSYMSQKQQTEQKGKKKKNLLKV